MRSGGPYQPPWQMAVVAALAAQEATLAAPYPGAHTAAQCNRSSQTEQTTKQTSINKRSHGTLPHNKHQSEDWQTALSTGIAQSAVVRRTYTITEQIVAATRAMKQGSMWCSFLGTHMYNLPRPSFRVQHQRCQLGMRCKCRPAHTGWSRHSAACSSCCRCREDTARGPWSAGHPG